MPPPLPLENGALGRHHGDILWYFLDGRAAQSGLRSSQGMVEARLQCAGSAPPRRPAFFDSRLIEQIERARRIEQKLQLMPRKLAVRLYVAHDPDETRHLLDYGVAAGLAALTPTAVKTWKQADRRLGLEKLAHRVRLYKVKGKEKNLFNRITNESRMLYQEAILAYRETDGRESLVG